MRADVYMYSKTIKFTVILRAVARDMLDVTRMIRGIGPVLLSTNTLIFERARS